MGSHRKPSNMSIIHPHAAGVDIGSQFHVVAVASDQATEPVRTFQSFTTDLHEMAKWLKNCHVTSVAMESTGIYWIVLPWGEVLCAVDCKVDSGGSRGVGGWA